MNRAESVALAGELKQEHKWRRRVVSVIKEIQAMGNGNAEAEKGLLGVSCEWTGGDFLGELTCALDFEGASVVDLSLWREGGIPGGHSGNQGTEHGHEYTYRGH